MTVEHADRKIGPHIAALQRAMPYTRLVDCGMNPADARRLLEETASGAEWVRTATQIADDRAEKADAAARTEHRRTAVQSTRWAAAAALFAQMAENLDTPVKAELYARYVSLVTRVSELSEPIDAGEPNGPGRGLSILERVELPYRDGRVVGWLNLPRSGSAKATVVVCGGLSGWGAAYLAAADALADRGIACLLAEGPGQGEPRIFHHLYVDTKVADGFARFIDFVVDDPRLGDRLGVCGNSFGGLFAAHLAAQDFRVGACVVNGAPPAPELPPFRTARDQFAAAFGTDDETELSRLLDGLRFDPDTHPIGCPVLVLHGGRDVLLPDDEAQAPFARAAGERGELRIWPDGEHTLYNHALERDALIADWFVDHLRST